MCCLLRAASVVLDGAVRIHRVVTQVEPAEQGGPSPPGALWGAAARGEASSPRAKNGPALFTVLLRKLCFTAKKNYTRDKSICDGCMYPTSAHQSVWPACPKHWCQRNPWVESEGWSSRRLGCSRDCLNQLCQRGGCVAVQEEVPGDVYMPGLCPSFLMQSESEKPDKRQKAPSTDLQTTPR